MRRAHDLSVGVEDLLAGVDAVEVDIGGYLRAHLAWPDNALEKLLDGAGKMGLQLAPSLIGLAGGKRHFVAALLALGEQRTLPVDDRDATRRQS